MSKIKNLIPDIRQANYEELAKKKQAVVVKVLKDFYKIDFNEKTAERVTRFVTNTDEEIVEKFMLDYNTKTQPGEFIAEFTIYKDAAVPSLIIKTISELK